MADKVNFRQFKRSKPKLQPGDIFSYSYAKDEYRFGRIVLADHQSGPMPGADLIYFYRQSTTRPVPDRREMKITDLLIEPVWTNRQGWTRGYFLHVAPSTFEANELPDIHCFHSNVFGGKFLDQNRHFLAEKTEPCGEWMLVSYRWVDDRLSDALGIPRASDELR